MAQWGRQEWKFLQSVLFYFPEDKSIPNHIKFFYINKKSWIWNYRHVIYNVKKKKDKLDFII